MKIAIVAYGVEGKASYDYYSKDPNNDITIFDQNPNLVAPEGVKTVLGADAFEHLTDYDLILRSPPIAPSKLKTNGKIWSVTNEFFEKCPVPIIGVTGTKGKGTTSSMIASMFEASGKKVWLIGNIGTAALEVLDQIESDDVVVYELSSFQLWDAERSPHVSVVLPIEAEHLDVHKDFQDYLDAKANIASHQKSDDICVFNPNNEYSRLIGAASGAGKRYEYTTKTPGSVYMEDNFFKRDEQIICSTSEVQIMGSHFKENACAAVTVANELGLSNDDIAAGLRNFKGLKHRLSFVRTVNDVEYYDDSIATTPGSAIAALQAFNKPEIIILGGSSKGSDFSELAEEIKKHDARAILIGDEGPVIAEAFKKAGFDKFETIEEPTMSKVVLRAHELAQPGSVVLLSPSAASFGLFKDYVDRGDQFISAVEAL